MRFRDTATRNEILDSHNFASYHFRKIMRHILTGKEFYLLWMH